ncbi:NAD(P)-binding protein [Piedraia hortae CBS 480.64]|uniref:NAD(P)-binding protein n=1 Tax=Piedraia hortae CBS 480.64 TaxID=1314780 RepID=A0A6A7BWY3_9PEZI|nr:NAD(P)-binding protein [Piedraia hortae CBS 480.64]
MAAHSRNVLIFGATNRIGEFVTRAVLEHQNSFNRIGVFASANMLWMMSDELDALRAQGVEIFSGNLSLDDDILEAFSGFDTVVSCLGKSAALHQKRIIELANHHPDVHRFIPCCFTTGAVLDSVIDKQQPELTVRAVLEASKTLEYTCLVTGLFAEGYPSFFLGSRPPSNEAEGMFDVQRQRAVLLGDVSQAISLTTIHDCAAFVVATLLRPDQTRNRFLRVNSFTATPKAILEEFEKQTGGSWNVSYTSLDTLKNKEKAALHRGDYQSELLTMKRIMAEKGLQHSLNDNAVIAIDEKDSLEVAVQRAIEVQRHN